MQQRSISPFALARAPGRTSLERQGTGRRHGVSVVSWSRQFVLLPEQTVSGFKFQFPNLNFAEPNLFVHLAVNLPLRVPV